MRALGATGVAQAQKVDRSKHPTPAPPPAFVFPKVEDRTLSNGLKVSVVENHELPVVAVRAVIEGGSNLDPVGKEGMFQIMNAMLREGTATMTADQLAEAFSDQGNSVNPTGFTTIVRNLDRSLVLMTDMLAHPAFPQDALDRQKANLSANLQRAKDQPTFVAQRIFDANVYGVGHPYERTATAQSIAAITRDDLVKFHGDYLRPQNVHLVIVGDVTPATVLPRVERVFSAWGKGGMTVSYDIPPAKGAGKTTIYLYDRPNSPQSVVTIGQLGPSRSVDDFFALDLMNTVLGQLSGSRLSQNLREKHAYTYGINTFWQWRRSPEVGDAAWELERRRAENRQRRHRVDARVEWHSWRASGDGCGATVRADESDGWTAGVARVERSGGGRRVEHRSQQSSVGLLSAVRPAHFGDQRE